MRLSSFIHRSANGLPYVPGDKFFKHLHVFFLEGVHKIANQFITLSVHNLFPSNKLRSTLPPSTCSSVPVVKLESSLDRNSTALGLSGFGYSNETHGRGRGSRQRRTV